MRLLHTKSLFFMLALMPLSAVALDVKSVDFKSVAVPKAILYDAPSTAAKKMLILSQSYPVEIIVNLGDWLKVRDAAGSINWLEAKQLSVKRMIMVTEKTAEIRQSADVTSKLVATIEKDVVLELTDAKPSNGWLKVKHKDGATGYILMSAVWGFS